MLSIEEKEILKEKVSRLLWEVGMKVENEEIILQQVKGTDKGQNIKVNNGKFRAL